MGWCSNPRVCGCGRITSGNDEVHKLHFSSVLLLVVCHNLLGLKSNFNLKKVTN